MSRIANKPVDIPDNVEANINNNLLTVKGPLGEMKLDIHGDVDVQINDNIISVNSNQNSAMAGTMRSLICNNVVGVSTGFEKKLMLVGVGYKAEAKDKKLNLSLGFSHPIVYEYDVDLDISTPSPTEVLIKGVDKQKVGQAAAEIRAYRPPEPYKGKGIREKGQYVLKKEGKKK